MSPLFKVIFCVVLLFVAVQATTRGRNPRPRHPHKRSIVANGPWTVEKRSADPREESEDASYVDSVESNKNAPFKRSTGVYYSGTGNSRKDKGDSDEN